MDRNRRRNDEWGQIMQLQAQVNAQREKEEQDMLTQNKQAYRNDLNYLQQFKQQAKQQENYLRNLEANEVKQRTTLYEEDVKRENEQKRLQQNEMMNFYQQHEQYQKTTAEQEKQAKINDEQNSLSMLNQRMKMEADQEKQRKENENKEFMDVLQYRRFQEGQRKQNENQEKMDDYHRALELQRGIERREQEYRDYYKQVDVQQTRRQQDFQQKAVAVNQQKDSNLNSWISQNEQDYKRRQAEKEQREQEITAHNLRNTKDTLLLQMHEKQRLDQLRKQEYDQNAQAIRENARRNQEMEQQERDERARQQKEYSDMLKHQHVLDEQKRDSEFQLSEKEKAYHRNAINQLTEVAQRAGPQVQKPTPPIRAPWGPQQTDNAINQNAPQGMQHQPSQSRLQAGSPSVNPGLAANAAKFYDDDKPKSRAEIRQSWQPTQQPGQNQGLAARYQEEQNSGWNPGAAPHSQSLPPRYDAPSGRYGATPNRTPQAHPFIHPQQSNPQGIPQPRQNSGQRQMISEEDMPAGGFRPQGMPGGHNPITNPVGATIPIPGDRPMYRGSAQSSSRPF